jgi:hypothetical protein
MTQQTWLQTQLLLDDGVAVCTACDTAGTGAYCQQCGTALYATPRRDCPKCRLPGPGPYCQHCGTAILTADLTALESDTFDWAAWEQELQPVLQALQRQAAKDTA